MVSVEGSSFVEVSERIPVDRFEWERIVRRMQMPHGAKYLALMLATYADGDGSRIRPGVERLSLVMCVTDRTVKRSLSVLRELGLIALTKKGNRHAKQADEYRLTVPATLLDHSMLDPAETSLSGGHLCPPE
ncbi:helix-turn-helix domain-containing protein [Nocardia cyriacigeorgica]|uniref:Helix-turn-helix domain-containing protein n=1 Tax=Nocardia cyriacigeorgica TaxID=135487 RepID=A0ABX0CD18_9NOCA|nr:helix-turn-helix domain-containing protein [Nocardia cyriacigeorgica]NEW42754.1 helix-turn-helix domain-containing protein [Nocardia cyriacigeorgica]NEW53951.1 helix-turn-helix domain-containing protein [Nocardia cyriacigeorgica]NEW54460.1 helix-turn-helix domain-containing protein [Nocardia cyriacigeorgica]